MTLPAPSVRLLICGAADFLPKQSLQFTDSVNKTFIVACDPIPVAGLTLDDVPALAERTRAAIVAMRLLVEGEPAASDAARA